MTRLPMPSKATNGAALDDEYCVDGTGTIGSRDPSGNVLGLLAAVILSEIAPRFVSTVL